MDRKNTIQVYSVTVLTHDIAIQPGYTSSYYTGAQNDRLLFEIKCVFPESLTFFDAMTFLCV